MHKKRIKYSNDEPTSLHKILTLPKKGTSSYNQKLFRRRFFMTNSQEKKQSQNEKEQVKKYLLEKASLIKKYIPIKASPKTTCERY